MWGADVSYPLAPTRCHAPSRIVRDEMLRRSKIAIWTPGLISSRTIHEGSGYARAHIVDHSGGLAPGEDGLLEIVHPGTGLSVDSHPPELQQNGTGRCVDQIATDGHLHDRPVALGNRDEAR